MYNYYMRVGFHIQVCMRKYRPCGRHVGKLIWRQFWPRES